MDVESCLCLTDDEGDCGDVGPSGRCQQSVIVFPKGHNSIDILAFCWSCDCHLEGLASSSVER